MFTGKKFRPLLTAVCVILGGLAGSWAADWYTDAMRVYLADGAHNFIWFIPRVPAEVTKADSITLHVLAIILGAMIGFVIERLVFIEIMRAKKFWLHKKPQDKAAVIIGIIIGFVFTVCLSIILNTSAWLNAALALVLCYICTMAVRNIVGQFRFYFPEEKDSQKSESKGHSAIPKLLDTNVIIDGRIIDLCRTGFLEDPVYVPKFILEELQLISDSADALKRARGRRGLDILNRMREEFDMTISDFEGDEPGEPVDSRLVAVAKANGAAIVTNDFNLSKVAELQGIKILNIHRLANSLKPVVLPGERMRVTVNKEGKERDQGIGYLDDGTLIVVDGGRDKIGENLSVIVTSVLQTAQGKMIFTKVDDKPDYKNRKGGRHY